MFSLIAMTKKYNLTN